jgi:hypothetical protein
VKRQRTEQPASAPPKPTSLAESSFQAVVPPAGKQLKPHGRRALAGASVESVSDHATTSQVLLSLSPVDALEAALRPSPAPAAGPGRPAASGLPSGSTAPASGSVAAAPRGGGEPSQRSRPPLPPPAAGPSAKAPARSWPGPPQPPYKADEQPESSAAHEQPSTSGRAGAAPAAAAVPPRSAAPPRLLSGVSVETQTPEGGDNPLLPPGFLDTPRPSGTALAYGTIGPPDLLLEPETREGRGPADGRVAEHMDAARSLKREGDRLFEKQGRVWNLKALSKYVSASLMFMEAADSYVRDHRRDAARSKEYAIRFGAVAAHGCAVLGSGWRDAALAPSGSVASRGCACSLSERARWPHASPRAASPLVTQGGGPVQADGGPAVTRGVVLRRAQGGPHRQGGLAPAGRAPVRRVPAALHAAALHPLPRRGRAGAQERAAATSRGAGSHAAAGRERAGRGGRCGLAARLRSGIAQWLQCIMARL